MTFYEAAIEVLRDAGRALNYKKIAEIAIKRDLLSHVGKHPEETMGHRLLQEIKKSPDTTLIQAVRPGVYTLRDGSDLNEARETINLHPAPEVEEVAAEPVEGVEASEGEEVAEATEDGEAVAQSADGEESGGRRSRRSRSRRGRGRREDADPAADAEAPEQAADAAEPSDAQADDSADDDESATPAAGAAPEDDARSSDRRRRRRGRRGGRGRAREDGDDDGDAPSDGAASPAAAAAPEQPRPVQRPIPLVYVPADRTRDAVGDIARAASEILSRRDDRTLSVGRLARDLSKSGVGSFGLVGGTIIRSELERANADRAADGRPPMFEEIKPNHWAVAEASGSDLAASYGALDAWQDAHRKVLGAVLMDRVRALDDEALGSLVTVLLDRMGYRDLTRLASVSDEVATICGMAPRCLTQARVVIRVTRGAHAPQAADVVALRDGLEGYGATEAALICLGEPDRSAVEESERLGSAQVALVGPDTLAEYLLEHRVGVRTMAVEVSCLDETVLRDIGEAGRR